MQVQPSRLEWTTETYGSVVDACWQCDRPVESDAALLFFLGKVLFFLYVLQLALVKGIGAHEVLVID